MAGSPPSWRPPREKLGYEATTAVGSGDTTLSYIDEAELIEQWSPDKEVTGGGQVQTRVRPGTRFVLMSDGISDNLPVEVIDQLLERHTLATETVGLPRHARERRAQMQKRWRLDQRARSGQHERDRRPLSWGAAHGRRRV